MKRVRKASWIFKNHGFSALVIYIIKYFSTERTRNKKLRSRVLRNSELDKKFLEIYEDNLWGSSSSRSGPGSEPLMTENLRVQLPRIIENYKINTMVDIPCGDFSWMKEVIDISEVHYLGIDIVEPLIKTLKLNHEAVNTKFVLGDMRHVSLPTSDLVVSRDILFHLSYFDISLYLELLLKSKSKYFLTTSYHTNFEFKNTDIVSGDFRLLNLFTEPFNFPRTFIEEIQEPSQNYNPSRSTYLWKTSDLIEPIRNFLLQLR